MKQKIQKLAEVCETCFRIACKQCDWIASNEEVQKIQAGILVACPECGWKPERG